MAPSAQRIPEQLDPGQQHARIDQAVEQFRLDAVSDSHAHPDPDRGKWQQHQRGGHVAQVQQAQPGVGNPLRQVDEKEKDLNPVNKLNYERMNENYNILKNAKDQNGESFTIIKVPLPDLITKKIKARKKIDSLEVTFDVDANGIMHISAKDKGTGKQQSIKIEASSGLSDEEIQRMKAEAEANAESDNKKREEVETINKADSLIFQTERQMKEYGDKIPADKKQGIEEALTELKAEFEARNIQNLEPAMEKLNNVFQAASQEMYNAANDGGDAGAGAQDAANPSDEVTDVDFEEVDEKK